MKQIPEVIHCGAFIVKTFQLRNQLINKCEMLGQAVQKTVAEIAQAKSTFIQQLFFAINRKLTAKSKNIEEVCVMENFIKNRVDSFVEIMRQNIKTMNDYYAILEELFSIQNNAQVAQRWKTIAFPKDIATQVEKSLKIIQEDKLKYKDEQQDQQNTQAKNIEVLSRSIASFGNRYTKVEDF